MASRYPIATATLIALMGLVAWRVTGFFPTEQSLAPLWWSREAWQAGQTYRLFTSIVAHGGIIHLGVNAIALASLASLEREIGTVQHALVFLTAAIGGNLAHAWASATPAVGASGGLFGLLGLLVALAPSTRLSFFGIPVPAVILLPAYAAAVVFVPGLQELAPIAHMAHLGGLAVGLASGLLLDTARAVEHLAYACLAFAAVGAIVINLHAVGVTTLPGLVLEQGLVALVTKAWPSFLGLTLLGWVAWSTPEEEPLPSS